MAPKPVGTRVDARNRRPPRWAARRKRPLPRLRKRRQPGAFEEALAREAPPAEVVPRRARSSAGYALLRAAGWQGPAAASEAAAAHARAPFGLAALAAAAKAARSPCGAGYTGEPPVRSPFDALLAGTSAVAAPVRAPARVVRDGPDVYDDVDADGDDDGGLDAAAARMQLALSSHRKAARAPAALSLDAFTPVGEPFKSFSAPRVLRDTTARAGAAYEVLVNGKPVTLKSVCLRPAPPNGGTKAALSPALAARLDECAERERARLREVSLQMEAAAEKQQKQRLLALERTRALSSEIMKDEFVSASNGTDIKPAPKRPRKVDDTRRTTAPWAPESRLCKLFDVPVPPRALKKKPIKKPAILAPELDVIQGGEADDNDDDGFEITGVAGAQKATSASAGMENAATLGSGLRNEALVPVLKAIFEPHKRASVRAGSNTRPQCAEKSPSVRVVNHTCTREAIARTESAQTALRETTGGTGHVQEEAEADAITVAVANRTRRKRKRSRFGNVSNACSDEGSAVTAGVR
eukprot:IDg11579t1